MGRKGEFMGQSEELFCSSLGGRSARKRSPVINHAVGHRYLVPLYMEGKDLMGKDGDTRTLLGKSVCKKFHFTGNAATRGEKI